jgi:AbrB family looped-hinge helix DNA binding protein
MRRNLKQSHMPVYTVELGDRGRLVLPASLRNELGLAEGDRFVLTLEGDGSIHLASLRSNISRLRGSLKHKSKNRSLVDELIAERRAEAAIE